MVYSDRRIANGKFWESAKDNKMDYALYFYYLLNICLNRFKWENVPIGFNMRYFEMMLITQGSGVLFYEDALDRFLSLGVAYEGTLDVYGEPSEYNAVSANGEPFRLLNPENSVLVWNNKLHSSEMPIIESYARKLWDLKREIIINSKQQKFASIIKVPETQRLTFANLMKKYQGNEMFIFADDSLNIEGVEPFGLNIPFVAPEMINVCNNILNEALTQLGIMSGNSEKSANLTLTESFAPFGQLELTRDSLLSERQKACDKFNAIFGANMTVSFNSEIPISPMQSWTNGGTDVGKLYDHDRHIAEDEI